MPYDATYEDLFAAYLDLCWRYSEAVANLIALQKDSDHSSFALAAPLTRKLAAQVETARDRAMTHRLGS